jgi:hypothetical protein
MSKHTAYYQEAPVDQSDYPTLAEKFKIPYEVVFRCVEALQQTGEVPIMAFSGSTRERVRALAMALATDPPEATQDAPPEFVEVLYDSTNEKPYSVEELEAERVPELSNDLLNIRQATVQTVVTSYVEPATMADPSDVTETNFVDINDEFDPEETTERDEIVDHAAHGLMSAFSDSENCFIISDDGCCRINPDKPPSIEHSLVVVTNVLKLKDLGDAVEDKSSWMLGSIIAALEDYHGENFAVSQVCDTTTKAYNTVVTAVGVFKAFKQKRYKLSFSSHKEAHYAKIPDAHKRLILHKAETFKIGPKSIRALCSIAKTMEDDTTIRNIRSQKQALDLIAVYKKAKATYFIYDEGEWTWMEGLAGDPPEGKVVLNTKEKTAQVGNQILPISKRSNLKS